MELSFRWLPGSEYDKLIPICKEFDWALPHPMVGAVRIAETPESELVGVVCVDLIPHVGPVWIKPGHRSDRRIWREGFRAVREKLEPSGIFPGVILVAETEASAHIAKLLGMEKTRGELYSRKWR